MKKGWTTTKLIAVASLAVLNLILNLLGAGIVAATGIPLSGATNALVGPAMTMIGLLVIDQVGAATIILTVLGVLQLPLPLVGTPGFLPKVPIQLIEGVIADALYFLLKRNRLIASFVIGGLYNLYIGMAGVEVGRLFGIPGIEQAAKLVYSPLAIAGALVLGAIGGYLGWLIYSRIKNTAVVKRIQG